MGRVVKKTSTSQATSKTFNIPNKLHRQSHNARLKSALSSQKRKARSERKKDEERDPTLKEERIKKNIPATLERKRVWDERVEGAFPEEDEEQLKDAKIEVKRRKKSSAKASKLKSSSDSDDDEDVPDSESSGNSNEDSDEEPEAPPEETPEDLEAKRLAAREKAQASKAESEETSTLFPTLTPTTSMPKILITTNRNCHVHLPAEQLTDLFPNATYIPRGRKFSIKEICTFASKPSSIDETTGKQREPFTHVVVVNEDRKIVNAMTIVVLPEGPTFHFSMTNYKPPTRIRGHGNPTNHVPELILNNFLTPLGRVTASLFQSMFPRQPEFKGRQVVTLHNQRDYIFFRRHRYVFRDRRSGEKPVGYGLEDMGKDGGNGSKGDESVPVKVGLQELGPQFTIKLRRVERGIKEGVEWEWKANMEKDRKKFNL
ncbi:Ribosome production factor 1 [Rhizina undulata]